MNWAAAYKWALAWSRRGCRVVSVEGIGDLPPLHRHTVEAYAPATTGRNVWAYRVTCTNAPTRYRPRKRT